ncbi:hypothetical protein PIB30_067069 [Stylosanthes scabra]|uniref:Replication protein A 70 kDa DNA-binding subunit B/D first OB fold domain-containing protein n=1 Tax=Stylosanthes scabra TaxID=79078 RepID=A0ABU6ZL98_9FABA|nr:hypothetical protein [Stylosanthes scabra]
MVMCYDLLSKLDESSKSQSYNIKVRVLKKSIAQGEHKYQKPMLEMVVMDSEGFHIQCSIRNPLRRFYEADIIEGKVYSITKFLLATNDQKYKPTTHACRIYFKRDTQMKLVNDVNFLETIFNFVPNEAILCHGNAQSHLIDVMGLLTGKGNTIEFMRNGKTCIYVILELDDMKVCEDGGIWFRGSKKKLIEVSLADIDDKIGGRSYNLRPKRGKLQVGVDGVAATGRELDLLFPGGVADQ